MRADHAIRRIVERQSQLLAEMVAQRATLIGDIIDAALIDVEVPGAAAADDRSGRRCTIGNTARVIGFAKIGVERRGHLRGQGVCLRQLRRIGGFAEPLRQLVRCGTFGIRQLGAVVALKQRIPLQLLFDEARHLDIGVLQQLDRLTQLRRHDERLGLAEIEAWP